MDFYSALTMELLGNIHNPYVAYSWVYEPASVKMKFINFVKAVLKSGGLYYKDYSEQEFLDQIKKLGPYMDGLNDLYGQLEMEMDKKLLAMLMANRIIGGKVKLPLFDASFLANQRKVHSLIERKLYKADLNPLFPLTVYQDAASLLFAFFLHPNRYIKNNVNIGAKDGDYVIDGGGCFGETALYFSNLVGKKGKVFSFEFIPSNLEIFRKNLELNVEAAERVIMIENPLWEKSDTTFYYKDAGAGSTVSDRKEGHSDGEIKTLTIDDLVERNKLRKIDFIKKDIEGAETFALRGAAKTIDKFSPDLCISLYHSLDDFVQIPKLIKSLNPNYKFYLDHFAPSQYETMLFATTKE